MICFAAFVPHSPLFIDSIGKENLKHLQQSTASLRELSQELADSHPDVIFMISSHSVVHDQAFSANLHDVYAVDFREFGDHATSREFFPDIELLTDIQRQARMQEIPFVLESSLTLDYGSGVPLFLLCEKISPAIVPISYSGFDRKDHMAFGRMLKDIALQTHKRVAIIASGDLSHALRTDAPMGYAKEGKEFDETILRGVEQFSASTLISLEDQVVEKAHQCALRPLLILFGILEKMEVRTQVLSYEAPFGVGYLIARFHL